MALSAEALSSGSHVSLPQRERPMDGSDFPKCTVAEYLKAKAEERADAAQAPPTAFVLEHAPLTVVPAGGVVIER